MSIIAILGIASIVCGFVLGMGSYMTLQRKGPGPAVWGLGAGALVFLTLIPVILAVFFATTSSTQV